ncbi:RDD family protein [Myxococcus stipitatus]|uniref:RDD family protein n=1 Tax=Myxococcus stipitatus TaxID=83455 RepID=UPI0030D26547
MSAPLPDVSVLSTEARCPLHPSDSAVAICQRCGTFACGVCLRQGPDGLSYCPSCISAAGEQLASRSDRFLANLLDIFVVFAPLAFTGFMQGFLRIARRMPVDGSSAIWGPSALLITGAVILIQLVGVARTGQSIGKHWRRIRVVQMDGSPASLATIIFVRNVLPFGVSQLTCGITGLLDIFFVFREDRRCLHDLLAGTQVVTAQPDKTPGHS